MQLQNHTKEYSIAVILHAVAKIKFDGGREREIATLIGVDPSNIPKYKDGSSKLSPNNIKLLIERYGPPKMAKGKYIKACLINTVDEYIQTFSERANHQFTCELKSLFSNQQLMEHLTNFTTEEVLEPVTEDESDWSSLKFNRRRCEDENRQAVVNWMIQQAKAPVFGQWSRKYEDAILAGANISNARYLPNLKQFDDGWEKTFVTETEQPLLYLFGYFINSAEKKVMTLSEALIACQPEGKQEVVVTGDSVLDLQASKQSNNAPKAAVVFDKVVSLMRRIGEDSFGYDFRQLANQLDSLREFSQVRVDITLHINEQMMYRILVDEYWGKHKNTTVIKDVRQDLIIEQFNKLAEFFGMAREHEDALKEAIASRGGYIPGATML